MLGLINGSLFLCFCFLKTVTKSFQIPCLHPWVGSGGWLKEIAGGGKWEAKAEEKADKEGSKINITVRTSVNTSVWTLHNNGNVTASTYIPIPLFHLSIAGIVWCTFVLSSREL